MSTNSRSLGLIRAFGALIAIIGVSLVDVGSARAQGAWEQAHAPNVKQQGKRVVVSIPPLKGIVGELLTDAGIAVDVEIGVLIPPGVSEHGYEIPPSGAMGIAKADLVVIVGLGLEPQVEKMLAERPRDGRVVINAAQRLGLEFPNGDSDTADAHAHHEHDADGNCVHDPHADPHFWLDPRLVERLIPMIAESVRPWAQGDLATARLKQAEGNMVARVKEMHDRYQATLAPATRRTIVVGHDAWGHLADRYQLKTVALKGLTASEPTAKSIAAAAKAVSESGVKVVFTEPQLNQSAAKRVAGATGCTIATLDPLGDGDWFGMMDRNLKAIAGALDVQVVERRAANDRSPKNVEGQTP